MRALLLCGCASLLVAPPAFATTYHVAPDSSGDVLNIQAAIDAAVSGDEIVLSDGTFHGDGNWDLNFGTKDLVLRSVNGYEATTIDCGCFDDPNWSKHRGIILEGRQTAATRIEGVTVQSSYSTGDGGAFRIVGASPVIRRVRTQRNPAFLYRGAGMFIQGGSPAIEGCVFIGYYGDWGPGSAIYGEQAWPNVQSCSFNACHGVAVRVDGGTFADCTFTDNLGHEDNQGVALSGTGQVAILRCTFRHTFGSAVTVGSGSLIDGCLFELNTGDYGAGVRGGNMTIRNSVFRHNDAGFTGSAIECYGAVSLDRCVFVGNGKDAIIVEGPATLNVTQCTFLRNGSHTYIPQGPGSSIAAAWGSPSITIDHSIIAFGWQLGSTAVNCQVAPAELVVTCSDIFGNPGGDWVGCLAGMNGVNGNLWADPLFCGVAGGDFGLQADSPCAPANSGDCGLIGALEVACGPTAVEGRSWGSIKALYR